MTYSLLIKIVRITQSLQTYIHIKAKFFGLQLSDGNGVLVMFF